MLYCSIRKNLIDELIDVRIAVTDYPTTAAVEDGQERTLTSTQNKRRYNGRGLKLGNRIA